MENFPTDWDLKNLAKELEQGRELARQLQINFNNVQSSSYETRQFLLHKILSSYDQALSILGQQSNRISALPPPPIAVDSPQSLAGSLHSDDSDQDLKDQASRKRKAMPRWTQRIQVCPETEIEKQLDDGYAWRKYGQKDILGAKHPRGYYRCTYRNVQGCLATKQVQRSDDDPTIFEITYRGKHTCNPGGSSNNNQPIEMPHPQNEDPNLYQLQSHQNEPPVFNTQKSPTVIAQDLDTNANPSYEHIINTQNNHVFLDCDNFLQNCPPNLMPLTISPNLMNDLCTSELTRIVTGTTSASDTHSTVGPNFPFGSTEFGSNFSYDRNFP